MLTGGQQPTVSTCGQAILKAASKNGNQGLTCCFEAAWP